MDNSTPCIVARCYQCAFEWTWPPLTDPQVLQGQMTGHQIAIDTLRKTAESLVTSEGDLLSNPDEIQETVGEENKLPGSIFGFFEFRYLIIHCITIDL